MAFWPKRELTAVIYFFYAIIRIFSKYLQGIETLGIIESLNTVVGTHLTHGAFYIINRFYSQPAFAGDQYAKKIKQRILQAPKYEYFHHAICVIKPASLHEKGILFIKYTDNVNAFPILFDMEKIQKKYNFYLEPSTASYIQPFLKLYHPDKSMIVVSTLTTAARKEYIRHGFIPTHLCPGDWIDADVFRSLFCEKKYHFCMVARFTGFKRHEFLFKALAKYWHGDLKFALISSAVDRVNHVKIRNLLVRYRLQDKVHIFMDLDVAGINKVLNESSYHVLCSEWEGCNRASFEALAAGTPAVISSSHTGFPKNRFSARAVRYYHNAKDMVNILSRPPGGGSNSIASEYRERSGMEKARVTLNALFKQKAPVFSQKWSRGIVPIKEFYVCLYRNPENYGRFYSDYETLKRCSRNGFFYDPTIMGTLLEQHYKKPVRATLTVKDQTISSGIH